MTKRLDVMIGLERGGAYTLNCVGCRVVSPVYFGSKPREPGVPDAGTGENSGAWLGYLQDFPDYWTQGDSLDDLKGHLRDLYVDLTGGQIPGVRRVDDLVVS